MKESSGDKILEPDQNKTGKPGRLLSLDALRGFDMFWIVGGGALFQALAEYTGWAPLNWMSEQLTHKYWEGFYFYDMIFPLFLFIAGVAMPFSLENRIRYGHTRKQLYNHAIRRLLILAVIGFLLANNGIRDFDWGEYRYTHVLIRIGIGWFFATVIFMNTGIRGQVLWFAGLLLGYWALMALVPVPGHGAGVLTPEGNLAGYIDRLLLPGTFYRHYFPEYLDPEGILGHIPAVSMALMGALTGQFLKMERDWLTPLRKGLVLGAAGLVFLGIGLLWSLAFPIIKKIWTSSFVIYAGGWSLLLLSVFYLLIDVWKLGKGWSTFFIVIGSNAIFIYVCQSGVLDFKRTKDFFFRGLIEWPADPGLQQVIAASGYLLVSWLFLYFMYRRKIFLKV